MPVFGFSNSDAPHSSMPTSSASLFAPLFSLGTSASTHDPATHPAPQFSFGSSVSTPDPATDPALQFSFGTSVSTHDATTHPAHSSSFLQPFDPAHSLHPAYGTSGVDAYFPWRPSMIAGPSYFAYKGSDWFLPSVPVDYWNHLDADFSIPISSSSSPVYSSSDSFSVQQDTSLAQHASISSSVFAQLDTSSARNWTSASGYLHRDLASTTTSSPLVHFGCSKIGDHADKIPCGVDLSRSQLPAQNKKGLGRMSDPEINETCVGKHNQNLADGFSEPYLPEKQRLERMQHTPGLAEMYSGCLGKESIDSLKESSCTLRKTSLLDVTDSSGSLQDGTAWGLLGVDPFLNAQNVSYEPLENLKWNKGVAPDFDNQQKQQFTCTLPSLIKMPTFYKQDSSFGSRCNAPVTDVYNYGGTHENFSKDSTEAGNDKLGRQEVSSTSDTFFNFEQETGSKLLIPDGEKEGLDDMLAAEKVEEGLTGCQVETNACQILITSIHNLSKVLLGKLSNNSIDEFNAQDLQSSICVLSQCLLKQSGSVTQMTGVALESVSADCAGMKSNCNSEKQLEMNERTCEQGHSGTETQGMQAPHKLAPQAALENAQDPLKGSGNNIFVSGETVDNAVCPRDENVTENSYLQEAGQQSDLEKITRDGMTNLENIEESIRNLCQLQAMIVKMKQEISSERTESKAAVLIYKNLGIEALEALASCRSQIKEAKQELENLQQMVHSGTSIQVSAFNSHETTVDSGQHGKCSWTKYLPVSISGQEKAKVREGRVSYLAENCGEHEPSSKFTEVEREKDSASTFSTSLGKRSVTSIHDQLGNEEVLSGHDDPTMHVEENKQLVEVSSHLPDLKKVMSNSTPFQAITNDTSFEGSEGIQGCSSELVSQTRPEFDAEINCDAKCVKKKIPIRGDDGMDLDGDHADTIEKEQIIIRTMPVNREVMGSSSMQSVRSLELGLASLESSGTSALLEKQCMQETDSVKGGSNSNSDCSVHTKTVVRDNYFDGRGAMTDGLLDSNEQLDWKAVPVWLEVGSGKMPSSDQQAEMPESIQKESDWEHVLEFKA